MLLYIIPSRGRSTRESGCPCFTKNAATAILTLSRLTLSWPQARNAWGEDYNEALKEMLPRLEDDAEIRVVVLTGDEAGGAFSAGADTDAAALWLAGDGKREIDRISRAAEAIGVFGVPTFVIDGELFLGSEHLPGLHDKLASPNLETAR
jgi:2-hydroxychromene-2-carboxylate isomerase